MPVSANKVLYDIRRKYGSVNSGRSFDFRVVDLVSFANDAYQSVIEHLISEKDQNETIRNHLRPLMKAGVELLCKSTGDDNICKVKYPGDFYELINIRIRVKCDGCNDIKEFDIDKPQGDDINAARKNPYRRANFYFEQGLAYEDKDGLRIYHDKEYKVLKVIVDYYKKIQRIEAAELVSCEDDIYRNWDNEIITGNVDFEIDSTYLDKKISDVAVYFLGVASGDYQFSQSKLQEIISINQLHK